MLPSSAPKFQFGGSSRMAPFPKCTSMKDSFARFGKPGAEYNPASVIAIKTWIASLRG